MEKTPHGTKRGRARQPSPARVAPSDCNQRSHRGSRGRISCFIAHRPSRRSRRRGSPEPAPTSREPRARRCRRHTEQLGHLARRIALEVVEVDRTAIAHRQLHHRADKLRMAGAWGCERLDVVVDVFGTPPQHAVERRALVDGDADKPTLDMLLAFEPPLRAIQLEQHVLHNVLGVGAVLQITKSQPVHRALIRVHLPCEQRLVAHVRPPAVVVAGAAPWLPSHRTARKCEPASRANPP